MRKNSKKILPYPEINSPHNGITSSHINSLFSVEVFGVNYNIWKADSGPKSEVSLNHDSSLACKGLDDVNYTPCLYPFGFMMLCSLIVAIFFKFRNENDANPSVDANPSKFCQKQTYFTLFVLLTVFVAGFSIGFVQTFLFWHLQSLGGTQRLFSLMIGLGSIGEMVGFMLSVKLISKYGHLKVLASGMLS